jgi:Zn-dependent peptidase ImmA (M78 family)/DNA-binding XRE family transcriptional regulator
MSATGEAFITPAILRWARARSRLSQEELAKKINTKQQTVALWEAGDKRPTFRQAQTVANKLKIPFGYLFLSAPPEESIPLPDFRTKRSAEYSSPTVNFIDLLNDALAKQSWYREFLEEDEAEPLSFVAKFALNSDPAHIAADISSVVGINDGLRRNSANWEEFLTAAINNAERLGILVMRSGLVGGNTSRSVSPEEFRGFTVSDHLAPLIFINSGDAKAAQIFTLAHELAHLWTGQTGISNEDSSDFGGGQVEEICNKVAAETLVPETKFREIWSSTKKSDLQLSEAVHFFRVSSLVVLGELLN